MTPQAAARSPLRHIGFRMLLLGIVGLFAGYTLLLPVVPLWVVAQGGSEFVAGAVTGVFMAATVLTQLTVPAQARRWGYRAVSIMGALFLGLPSPLLLLATSWPGILAISLVRGIGFGLVTVCGSALIAELLPSSALGRGSAWYGVAVGCPQLVGLAAGALLAKSWGFGPVFAIAGALPMAAVVALARLPMVRPAGNAAGTRLDTARSNWRPWLVMISGSTGFGSLVTFLPIVFGDTPAPASAALFTATGAILLSRWAAGSLGDRLAGAGRLLPLGVVLCVLGMAGLTVATAMHSVALAVVVTAVFGLGFGTVQNDALVVMFARSPAGPASVAWNMAFDGGTGLGAVLVGAIVAGTGYAAAFGALAAISLVLLPLAVRGRTGSGTKLSEDAG